MAKTSTKLSELMTIRDILMGEIIEEYNGRFEELEKAFTDEKAAAAEREAQLQERINELTEALQRSQNYQQELLAQRSTQDKEALGALFLSLGQQLKSS